MTLAASECGRRAEDDVESFAAVRELDAKRRRHRSVKSNADTEVALEPVEGQIARCAR